MNPALYTQPQLTSRLQYDAWILWLHAWNDAGVWQDDDAWHD